MSESHYRVEEGLATLNSDLVHIFTLLDQKFELWANTCGAETFRFPPFIRISDLSDLDFFRNFPHLGLLVTQINDNALKKVANLQSGPSVLEPNSLTDSEYVIPSAACYHVYLYLKECVLKNSRRITLVTSCCRNEDHYSELQRLRAFTMREIVCVGEIEDVRSHLDSFKRIISDFSSFLDLPLDVRVATDPFYNPFDPKKKIQKLFPVKEEFVYGDDVAVASLNFHRNFFGERCGIHMTDGKAAFSGCVAFGLERWLHALLDRYNADCNRIAEVLNYAAKQTATR